MATRMLLLMDENVPESVAQVFRGRGHEVWRVVDVSLPGTPDRVLAALADEYAAIIVTWNRKDFRSLAGLRQSDQFRHRKLGCINFKCQENEGRHRAEQMMSRIEFEYDEVQKLRDQRVLKHRQYPRWRKPRGAVE